jgi:rubrerythrin
MSDQTLKNLKDAFAGESQANRRYTAFSQKAAEEGYQNVARLFRAVAISETIHAINHLKNMGGVKSTLENVEEAWKGEKEEYNSMYPMFMDQAKRDRSSDALKSFFWANEAEKVHGALYERAKKLLAENKDIAIGPLYICTKCGFTVESTVPDKCPVCGEGRETFQQVE